MLWWLSGQFALRTDRPRYYHLAMDKNMHGSCNYIDKYATIQCKRSHFYQEYLVYNIEKVQRCAARWVPSDYSCYSNVTEMLNSFGCPTLYI